MQRSWCASCLAILFVCLSARAQPPEPAVQREGRAHYEKGLASYHLGDFPTAIDEFKTAYTLTKAPRLLFDIAQAQRLSKEYAAALYSYNTYLRLVPGAPNRADVQMRIAELTRLLAEHNEVPPSLPPQPSPEPSPPPRPQDVSAEASPIPTPEPVVFVPPVTTDALHRAAVERWTGLGVAIGGAILFAAAAGCTATAASRGDTLRDLQSKNGAWNSHYQDLYDEGLRDQRAAAALWAIGGAAVITGAVLAIVGMRAEHRLRAQRLQLQVGAGGVGLRGSFR
jgi:hypothetical protein